MSEEKHSSSDSSGKASPVNDKKESLHLNTSDAALEKQVSDGQAQMDINAKLANPLKQFSREEVAERGRAFAVEANLPELEETFAKAALVARDPTQFENMPELSDEEKEVFRRETTHKWSYPKTLYLLVISCSISAMIQGMDQSVINGANLFWAEPDQLNVSNPWQKGIVNAIPYFSSALLASWFTAPCNAYLGRKKTLWISCFIAFATCLWSGFVGSWYELLIARLFLGFAIGPKSATTPVYAGECAPAGIRGGLVMQWQLWTAFGIAMGYVADIGFYFVADPDNLGLNWRLMLGSALIPTLPMLVLLFFVPESPRWYISKGRFAESFHAMRRLRNSDMQAARDCYFAVELIRVEEEVKKGVVRRVGLVELFSNQRNRKGVMASSLVMFMQQFCGINVIAYYSSSIFLEAIDSQVVALSASLGFGLLNFLGGIPAIWTIDTFGRRSLLLVGYPLMSIFLFWTGFSFWLPEGSSARIGMIAVGIYLHCLAYSPTSGPVPFSYSAESFPLYIRDIGMSWAVSLTWFFNGVLSLTFPAQQEAFSNQGAFSWYAAWNIFGFIAVYFLLPETKGLSLEELESVFSVSNREHFTYMWKKMPYYVRKIFFFSKEEYKGEPLYAFEKLTEEERKSKGTFARVMAGH